MTLTALLLAVVVVADAKEKAPDACPPFGAAVCPAQGDCGASPQHNLAYALRVGHLDFDPVSRKLWNQGTHGPDWTTWDYFDAPPFENKDAWCLEECGTEDPGARCVKRLPKSGPPARRPQHPPFMRCFRGEVSGGLDYTQYLGCGAPANGEPGSFVMPIGPGGLNDPECTGDDPRCVCVKGIRAFDRYKDVAAAATRGAFGGATSKPSGVSDSDATERICRAYNSRRALGPDTECRAQGDEIVLDDPRGPMRGFPAVSIDVVTSEGAFWSKPIAACAPGVH